MATWGYASPTNLRVQLNMLRTMIGEPFDYATEDTTAPAEGYYTTQELVDLIYQSEMQLIQDLGVDAFPGLLANVSRTTVDGTNTYDLPGRNQAVADEPPILRLLSIEADVGAGYLVPVKLVRRDRFSEVVQDGEVALSVYSPLAAYNTRSQLIIAPTPSDEAGAGKLVFRYVKVPPRRYRHWHGLVDASSTASKIRDASATHPTGFWTTDTRCTVRITSGILNGQERTLKAWDATNDEFEVDFAFSGVPETGAHYLVGEVSDLGDEFNGAVLAYAAFLALSKDRDPIAQVHHQEYRRQVVVAQTTPRLNDNYIISETRYGDEF